MSSRHQRSKAFGVLADWMLRMGVAKSSAVLTAIAIASSVGITHLTLTASGADAAPMQWLPSAILAPLLVSPVISATILTLAKRLQEAKAAIHEAAGADALTGAYNRFRLLEYVRAALPNGELSFGGYSALMIDVDHFKSINDTFGHAAGDAVLVAVAKACQSCLEDGDMLCRWGGEEFLVLLHRVGATQARTIAEAICTAVRTIDLGGGYRRVSVSVGVATATAEFFSFDRVVSEADRQMYLAKRSGRDRVACGQLPMRAA